MTNKEKMIKLDTTIQKRLGIRANKIWFELKRDLFLADAIRNHISLTSIPKVERNEKGNFIMNIYYDYYRKKMDEETIRQVEMWLLENIDKERLKKWLENDK